MKVKFIDNDSHFKTFLTVGRVYDVVNNIRMIDKYDVLCDDNCNPLYGVYKKRFQSIEKEDTKMKNKTNTLLAEDVANVIFNGNTTVVTLKDGRKGISKCDEQDEFDPYNGYVIAYYKAKHDKNFELKRMFNSCIEYSKKKGYKQTVIRNK